MHTEDIIAATITCIWILILLAKVVFGRPVSWAAVSWKVLKGVGKALIPIAAEEVARQGANAVFRPLSELGYLPPNTTALSLL